MPKEFPIFGSFSEEERKEIFEKIKNLGLLHSPFSIYNSSEEIIEPDSDTLVVDAMIILNAVQLAFFAEFMGDDYKLKPSVLHGRLDELEQFTRILLNLSRSLECLYSVDVVSHQEGTQPQETEPIE